MKYPNNLRDIRKNTNTKATDLANLLDVTFQHYYALERGDRQLSAQQLAKLSNFLHVTADEIINYAPSETNISIKEKNRSNTTTEDNTNDPYFRITQDAKNNGISPEDFAMALDFIKKFKNKEN